jgi:cbb3-type cytochrome oxidase subunit 3
MDQEDNTPWEYKPDGSGPPEDSGGDEPAEPEAPSKKPPHSVAWQAPEFIEHDHGAGWFLLLIFTTLIFAGITYWISHGSIFGTGIMIVLGGILWAYARQKPGQAQYEISASGISVNNKVYKYSDFKSFTIFREGPLSIVNLFPLKRFMPPVSAYFDPKDEKKIVDVLGNYLPYEDRQLDSIDRLSRRLRL